MVKRKGRKRKPEADRFPSGKIKPEAVQRDAMAIAIETRARLFGLGKDAAARAEAGSAIGRAIYSGVVGITEPDQKAAAYQAALAYEAVVEAAHAAESSPRRPRSSGDFGGMGGYDATDGTDPEYVERCERARAALARANGALLEADPSGRAKKAAELWILYDLDAKRFLPSLPLALYVLVRVFRTDQSAAA